MQQYQSLHQKIMPEVNLVTEFTGCHKEWQIDCCRLILGGM